MKELLQNILVAFALLVVVNPVVAHPGRTASDGCHYCRTNCAKWGVPKGVRHCHYAPEHGGPLRSSHDGLPETSKIYEVESTTGVELIADGYDEL